MTRKEGSLALITFRLAYILGSVEELKHSSSWDVARAPLAICFPSCRASPWRFCHRSHLKVKFLFCIFYFISCLLRRGAFERFYYSFVLTCRYSAVETTSIMEVGWLLLSVEGKEGADRKSCCPLLSFLTGSSRSPVVNRHRSFPARDIFFFFFFFLPLLLLHDQHLSFISD